MENKYYNTKFKHAYSGARNFPKSSGAWFKGQYAYTLHKPIKREFKRNKYFAKGILDFLQSDLADMSSLAKFNDRVKYLLFTIDVFSKFLWVVPLKRKTPEQVLAAFKQINVTPNLLLTDKGTEFQNDKLKTYFKNIKFYASDSPDIKAGVVERVILLYYYNLRDCIKVLTTFFPHGSVFRSRFQIFRITFYAASADGIAKL